MRRRADRANKTPSLADAEAPLKKKAKTGTTAEEENAETDRKNSTSYRPEWQAFKRYLRNPSRCPAKIAAACKNEDCMGCCPLQFPNSK